MLLRKNEKSKGYGGGRGAHHRLCSRSEQGTSLKKHPDIEKETCLKVRKGGFWGRGGCLKSGSVEPQKFRFETIAHA